MSERMSAAEYRALPRRGARNKYGARKAYRCASCKAAKPKGLQCLTCGAVRDIAFDSQAEARRFDQLVLEQRAGRIVELAVQPAFDIIVAGEKIATYFADFSYWKDGARTIEDVKSPATRTAAFRLKKKAVEAQYGIEIVEIRSRSKSSRMRSAKAAKAKR